jgi:hypothetical protein
MPTTIIPFEMISFHVSTSHLVFNPFILVIWSEVDIIIYTISSAPKPVYSQPLSLVVRIYPGWSFFAPTCRNTRNNLINFWVDNKCISIGLFQSCQLCSLVPQASSQCGKGESDFQCNYPWGFLKGAWAAWDNGNSGWKWHFSKFSTSFLCSHKVHRF